MGKYIILVEIDRSGMIQVPYVMSGLYRIRLRQVLMNHQIFTRYSRFYFFLNTALTEKFKLKKTNVGKAMLSLHSIL